MNAMNKTVRYLLKMIGGVPEDTSELPCQSQMDKYLEMGSLGERFACESFDEATGIYHNKHNAGLCYEVAPVTGLDEAKYRAITHLIGGALPEGCIAQFFLLASSRVGDAIEALYLSRKDKAEIHERTAREQAKQMLKCALPDLNPDAPATLRDYRLYISIAMDDADNEETIDALIQAKAEMDSSLTELVGGNGFALMNPQALINLVRELTAPSDEPYLPQVSYDPESSISSQIAPIDFDLGLSPQQMNFQTGWEVRMLVNEKFPRQWSLTQMQSIVGDIKSGRDNGIGSPFFYCTVIQIPKQSKQKGIMNVKAARWHGLSNGAAAMLVPNCEKVSDELQQIRARMEDGERIVRIAFFVGVISPKGKSKKNHDRLRARFQSQHGWELSPVGWMTFPAWLACLPMSLDNGSFNELTKFKMTNRLPAKQAIQFLPLLAEWKGTAKALFHLIGRAGQKMNFWPFENPDQEGNYNVFIAGKPGSGKSVTGQRLCKEIHGAGGWVRVLDRGYSYAKTCEILKGQLIIFDKNNRKKQSLNMFTHIQEYDRVTKGMLKNVFAHMAGGGNPLSSSEQSDVEIAVQKVWTEAGTEGNVDLVVDALKKADSPTAKGVAHGLFSFTTKGIYGDLFNLPGNVNFCNDFVVIELSELDELHDLRSTILMMATHKIRQEMMPDEHRQIIKMVLFEEAWKLLDDTPAMVAFMKECILTLRKYNASAAVVIQQIEQMFENVSGRAIVGNSAWMLLHELTSQVVHKLVDDKLIIMNDWQRDQFISLSTNGKRSEMLIKTPTDGFAAARLALDPFSRALMSSKGREYAAIQQLQSEGLSVVAAVDKYLEMERACA